VSLQSLQEKLFVLLQWFLPTRWLSTIIHLVAHFTAEGFKNGLIRQFMKLYAIDLAEAEVTDPTAYPHFNAFFTRALKPGARPLAAEPEAFVSPVDGRISEIGELDAGRLLQAKGLYYSASELLGEDATDYLGGSFCTIYLAPHNYHRIHMPMDARLTGWRYVPGRLFSVNPATARQRKRLFSRNERVCAYYQTPAGPLAIVFVGALFVGSIETVWAGRITPPHSRRGAHHTADTKHQRGQEIGRFNMGSTVILVAGPGVLKWLEGCRSGEVLRMGQMIARLPRNDGSNHRDVPAL
jgi:phosphatidylserine decarboxylase